MFEEVGGAVGFVGFGARAGVDPDANGARLGIRGVFCCDLSSLLVYEVSVTVFAGQWQRTVKPLLKVVLSVVLPWLTGVARLRMRPGLLFVFTELIARWARRPWFSLKARLREAMAGRIRNE